MSDSNIENILQELSDKIGDSSTTSSFGGGGKGVSFYVKPIYLYGGVPIILLTLFLVIRPGFIKKKDEKEQCEVIDMKKVVIYTAIFSIVIDIAIYVYLNKKR